MSNNWKIKARMVFIYIQGSFIILCYKKISKLKQNTINKNSMGKVINLISSDFNNM
jgi:hypothetical protein